MTLDPKPSKIRTTADGYTIDLGLEVYDAIVGELGGLRPHLVICHLKRSKVDVNRDILEGAQDNPVARAAHKTYHSFIRKAKSISKRGILLDLHGQVVKSFIQSHTRFSF